MVIYEHEAIFIKHGIEPHTAIYPGHPITIAFCMVHVFSSYAEAVEKDHHGCPRAVSSRRIPGAGGCCYSALDFLASLRKGTPLEVAFERADLTWGRTDNHQMAGGLYAKDEADRERFLKRWQDGLAQAALIKPLFRAYESWWS